MSEDQDEDTLPLEHAADEEDGYTPPQSVQQAAARGLELRRKFGRGGTEIGVARARDLQNGKSLSKRTIARMVSYFARHAVDAKADGWEDPANPSAGWIAWLLWGGDPGRQWCNSVWDRINHGGLHVKRSELIEGFTEVEGAEGCAIEKEARLFYTGRHKGREYTGADLASIADAFTAPAGADDWTVPVQLDHSDSARDTQGHVRRVWVDGDSLMGTLRFVGAEAVERVKDGRWKRLSVGLRIKPSLSLREVSLTPFPHLPMASTFTEGDDDNMETEEKAPEAVLPPADASANTQEPEPEEKQPEEKQRSDSEGQASHADRPEVVEMRELRQELERMRSALAERDTALRMKATEEVIESFTAAGKTVPAMRNAELAFIRELSGEQLEAYRALKELQPAIVEMGRRSRPSMDDPSSTDDEADALLKAGGYTKDPKSGKYHKR